MLSLKQKEFINNSTHRYNFKIGARRCGKTYLDILYIIPKYIREYKNKDGLYCIFGVSKGTIERNVLKPLREIYGFKDVGTINSNNIAIIFGQEIYCLGGEKANQVAKIQGSSIKFAYGDEVAKWNKDVFIMIQGSLDKVYSRFFGALNPENKNHWLKKDFFDKIEEKKLDVYLQSYTIFDNPFLSKEFVNNLCNEYSGTVYYNRLILGQWCDAEGIIFPMVANNKNRYIKNNEIGGIISVGIDWGGNKSYHTITATKISHRYDFMQVLKHEKLKATGTDTKDIFRWIINFIKEVQLKYGHITAIFPDNAEQVLKNSLITDLKENNIFVDVIDSDKIPIEDRIHLLTLWFNLDRIQFNENCDIIVEAISTCLFDEKADRDRWIDDGQTSDIDSMDSFCYSWTYFSDKLTLK